MAKEGWRPHIESALCLKMHRLFADASLRIGRATCGTLTWRNGRGEGVGSVQFLANLGDAAGTLTLDYSHDDRLTGGRKPVECVIRLSSVPLHFGGRRWYMHCPYTGRRALKLYKYAAIDKFCHRTNVRPLPTYLSQRVSGLARLTVQRWAIRERLGDSTSCLFDRPLKPKWMRRRTFERFAERDADLAEREDGYSSRFFKHLARMEG